MDNHNARIQTKNLSFAYVKDQPVIRNVSLAIPEGKTVALIGANGCGKSTLFKLLTGAVRPQDGQVSLDARDISRFGRREFAKAVAVVHQQNTAPDDMTVRKLVSLGRTPYHGFFVGGQTGDDLNAVDWALTMTDTAKLGKRTFSELSGGQKQRVWLAMALAQSTDILLLDEITTFLDIRYQIKILEMIRKLNCEHNKTIVMVLHDLSCALQYCDQAIVMDQGKILDSGPTDQVINGDNIKKAFGIEVKIAPVNGKTYCLF